VARSDGRPTIYLIGTPGHPHYGDEVITASWLRFYADHLPEADVWLDGPRPGQTAVLHASAHPRLRCVDTLFHAAWNAPSDDPATCLEFGSAVIDEPGRIPREASGVSAALSADIVHVLGGGYVNGVWPRHLALVGAARRLMERGARAAMTGAGLTPLSEYAARVLGEALSSFDIVDVRDEASHRLVSEHVAAVTNTGDDAFLDLQRLPVDTSVRTPAIVEVQSDLIETPLEELADQVVRLLCTWGLDQGPVLLLESMPPDDAAVAHWLTPHLPGLTIRPFEELWREGFPLSPRHRWITTRYHSHLMAAAAGAWGVALGASDLIAEQHASLLGLGSEWVLSRQPHDEVTPQPPVRDPFGGSYADIVNTKRAVAQRVLDLVLS
jgi:polysaccharide pyruvyl transferase WcaK-like protein